MITTDLHQTTHGENNRFLGIDFSGDHRQWGAFKKNSNVWLAEISTNSHKPKLRSLNRVQELLGEGPPFGLLVSLLAKHSFIAVGIDAPFSVPSQFIPSGDHRELLKLVSLIQHPNNRPFPSASDFVNAVSGHPPPLNPPKPLRMTERYWRKRGLNVRSTLWAGPRGGAAMTSACLTMIKRAKCPVWPWDQAGKPGLLVEAFPMAQLYHWNLPHIEYNGQRIKEAKVREKIVSGILSYLNLGDFSTVLKESADALDAVLCAFAAIAVVKRKIAIYPLVDDCAEGWIAIHK